MRLKRDFRENVSKSSYFDMQRNRVCGIDNNQRREINIFQSKLAATLLPGIVVVADSRSTDNTSCNC